MQQLAKTALTAGILSIAAMGAARADVISAQLVPPGSVPFTLEDLGTGTGTGLQSVASPIVTSDGETISWSGGSPAAGVYSGSVTNVARSPFSPPTNQNYLAAEPNGGAITISFASAQSAFNLLWGSVDNYNDLSFTFSGGGTTTTVTGSDIYTATGGLNFGSSDAAVEIGDLPSFTTVTVTSSQPAFEFVPGVAVPEPASLALLGAGLAGLGLARRRRIDRPAGGL